MGKTKIDDRGGTGTKIKIILSFRVFFPDNNHIIFMGMNIPQKSVKIVKVSPGDSVIRPGAEEDMDMIWIRNGYKDMDTKSSSTPTCVPV